MLSTLVDYALIERGRSTSHADNLADFAPKEQVDLLLQTTYTHGAEHVPVLVGVIK
jgi:hypothetical protein